MISIPATEILSWTSTFISMGVKFILAVYFFSRYSQEKKGITLVWGIGFFFFGLSQLPILAMRYFKDPGTNMAFALLGAFLAALSLAFLYYGTSLLYFVKGSFMQEKLSIIFFVIMIGVIGVFPFAMAPETVLKSVFKVVVTGFYFPITLLMAVIFIMIWRRLASDNPRKPNVLLVAAAWVLYSIQCLLTSTYIGEYFDWVFFILASCLFLMLLYGMTLGRATGH